MNTTVLILGAGVTGMKAASELIQQGFKVVLLEKTPRIEEKIERAGALFPPEENASCSIQPLLLDLFNHPEAAIITSAEILSLQGQPGNFKAEVKITGSEEKEKSKIEEVNAGAVIIAADPEEDKMEINIEGHIEQAPESGHPLYTARKGIFTCGSVQGSNDLKRSIIQACAAASCAASFLRSSLDTEPAKTGEKALFPVKPNDEPKIAVVLDEGEGEDADFLELDELAAYTLTIPGVKSVQRTPCAADGSKIKELISTGEFNRLIVAGPSPIPTASLYQRHAENAGLNPYLVEMVNLYNQCARVHTRDKKEATEKAKILMNMGIARLHLLQPLEKLKKDVTQSCLIIGVNPTGMACANRLAEMGLQVYVVDKEAEPSISSLTTKNRIKLLNSTMVGDAQGYLGHFRVDLKKEGKKNQETVEVGSIVVTSGSSIKESTEDSGFDVSMNLEKDQEGHYKSTQGILNLLDFSTEGMFNCGETRADLKAEDAVIEGEAAASRVACYLSKPEIIRSPAVSQVVNENCDGCAYCIEPCPTRSLTLLEYRWQDAIKKVAEVNETTCIGCGICMSTCPKQGIFVNHYRLESFTAMVKAAVEKDEFQPVIVSFCCSRCAYPGADAAGTAGIQYPPNVLIIRSVCSGMIHPNIIIDALTQHGADGVLLCGCHPGNCRSQNGITKAQARADAIELMLEDFGLELERFRLELISASDGPKFAQVVMDMTEEIKGLGPNPYKG
jgi:heterodisulfide reductase subunit A-like polyferredoxin/coenzyme F420-reducing hydrogenase delta subunit